ncbi:MAG: terpene cyclase/mutase family protein [Planctomycetia bacterium]|nr:terpene cyclase/mutase family protein [Planctomycetia bacterium]
MKQICTNLIAAAICGLLLVSTAHASDPQIDGVTQRGLDWLAKRQSRVGHWVANEAHYPTAMTALAGMALLAEGSTTTQGKYASNIDQAVTFLVERSNSNGLIGDAKHDDRYTYGHGFAMLFLSQVLGEEEDVNRRRELIDVLTRAVIFTGRAQTKAGGWGYVSARDGDGFDEGSTTITQVQGLRGCRDGGIVVPKEIIDQAIKYIRDCTASDGGVQYSSKGGGGRPAITAAAVACLFNAGDYDDQYVPKLLKYCKQHMGSISNQSFGHWHYAHLYYSQVMYREGGKEWTEYREKIFKKLMSEVTDDKKQYAYWNQGYIGPVYTTAINLILLQLDKGNLPIYQR